MSAVIGSAPGVPVIELRGVSQRFGKTYDMAARLARRTRNVSHATKALQFALWLWRDLYHWVHLHHSLSGRTPAMAMGLAKTAWTVRGYVCYPVHVATWQRALWAEHRENLLTIGLNRRKRLKPSPIS